MTAHSWGGEYRLAALEAIVKIQQSHIENLIVRMREIENAHIPWYVAECRDCFPPCGMPFRHEDDHRIWCTQHEEIGHRATTRVEYRHNTPPGVIH